MLRLGVNYLSSSSKSTNPPEFTVLLRPTPFQCSLFLLSSLSSSLFPTFVQLRVGLASLKRSITTHTIPNVATRNTTPVAASLPSIFRGRARRDTNWNKTREIFFHDRIIISTIVPLRSRGRASRFSFFSKTRSIRSASAPPLSRKR